MAASDWVAVALTGTGVAVAAGALTVAWHQLRRQAGAATANFILGFDNALRGHRPQHLAFRPGGRWARGPGEGPRPIPQDAEVWSDIEAYMGQLERLAPALRGGVELQAVRSAYAYRLKNLWAHRDVVTQKLVIRAYGWRDFLWLSDRLGLNPQVHAAATAEAWLEAELTRLGITRDEITPKVIEGAWEVYTEALPEHLRPDH